MSPFRAPDAYQIEKGFAGFLQLNSWVTDHFALSFPKTFLEIDASAFYPEQVNQIYEYTQQLFIPQCNPSITLLLLPTQANLV